MSTNNLRSPIATPATIIEQAPAGLLRRLAALLYDVILLIGMLFIAALPLPLFEEQVRELWWARTLEQIYLLISWFFFFGWFWTHGGQTLGMKVWRMKLLREDGNELRWRDALARFSPISACFCTLLILIGLGILSVKSASILGGIVVALGFLWILVDQERRAWHDLISGTRLVLVLPNR